MQVRRAERDYTPARRPPTSTGPSVANSPGASYSSEPPSTLLPISSGPASALILDSNVAQVIFQNQRNISEMQFRLPASLSDGISLPHHQIQAPGSFALMPENRLHFILLLTFDHHMGEGGLSSLSNSLDLWNLFRFDT